jgi:uncharacterized protein YbdZ (MbtH family)
MSDRQYDVVVNDAQQHALWPTGRAVPPGWTAVHGPATEADCLTYVETMWPDITPRVPSGSPQQSEARR